MLQADKNYVHGTAAKKLEYDVYEENRVLKAKKNQRKNSKAKLKAVFTIFVAFLFIFVVIYRYAAITVINYEIVKANKVYNEKKNENLKLTVDIEKETDLVKIRDIAETKLGMQKPDKSQTVHVSVPKEDFFIAANTFGHETKAKGAFLVLFDKIGKFTGLLY